MTIQVEKSQIERVRNRDSLRIIILKRESTTLNTSTRRQMEMIMQRRNSDLTMMNKRLQMNMKRMVIARSKLENFSMNDIRKDFY